MTLLICGLEGQNGRAVEEGAFARREAFHFGCDKDCAQVRRSKRLRSGAPPAC
jgi:hypothetical protein